MDIQHLVDRLEEVLNESSHVPLSAYLLINEERIYSIIDQMRVAIPEEVKRANRDAIMATAAQRAENILERSRRDAEVLRTDADVYVIEVLTKLEEDLLRSLAVVRNGMRKVQVEQETGERPLTPTTD